MEPVLVTREELARRQKAKLDAAKREGIARDCLCSLLQNPSMTSILRGTSAAEAAVNLADDLLEELAK